MVLRVDFVALAQELGGKIPTGGQPPLQHLKPDSFPVS